MLTLPPARLEAVAQLCIQEFRQFPPTQLVIVTFNREGQLIGTTRLLQPFDQFSTEQLLRYMVQAQAASALVADLSPWPLWSIEPSLQRLHEVDELLDQCQAREIELLDYLCIQGLTYCSLRAETDLWYAICA
jgi:DNA repair protein RadC